MDELKQRIASLSPERREVLRRLAPEQYAAMVSTDESDDALEQRLKDIWSEVLGTEVAREDNYFELGGDSVLSVSIVAKARAGGLPLSSSLLFSHPTVAQLAQALRHLPMEQAAESTQATAELQAAPLTPLQQGMVFHSRHDVGQAAYVSQLSCALSGRLDRDRVERAWTLLTQRHAVLQAAVDMDDPLQPRLRRYPDAAPVIEYRLLNGATAEATQQSLQAFLAEDLAREFDLARAPLMRLTLLETAQGQHRCVWTHHHVLLDGWSQLIILQEFQALYLGESLPPVTTSFLDYAVWLARRGTDDTARFWKTYLHGAVPLALPLAAPASVEAQAHIVVRLAAADIAVPALAQGFRVTPAILLEAAWALALSRIATAREVTFGLTATVRPDELADSELIVGLCINTLPMRIAIAGDGTVAQWLSRIQLAQHHWLDNAHASLPDVLRWTRTGRDIFDTLLVFENLPRNVATQTGAVIRTIEDVVSTVREHYPMVLVVTPGEDFLAELKYMAAAVGHEQAETAMALFECALRALRQERDMPALVARLDTAMHERIQTLREQRAADDRRRLQSARRAPIQLDPDAKP
jgi:aryl carrier-like protein